MPANKKLREEHRTKCEEGLKALEEIRTGYEDGKGPFSYNKFQLNDYLLSYRLKETERPVFITYLVDYFFTGIEPEWPNERMDLLGQSIMQRVLRARKQVFAKNNVQPESVSRLKRSEYGADYGPQKEGMANAQPAETLYTGYNQGPDQGYNRLATNHIPSTTGYGLSPISDSPNSHGLSDYDLSNKSVMRLWTCGAPIPTKPGNMGAQCPECGAIAPVFVDGAGRPQVCCPEHGYREPPKPEGHDLSKHELGGTVHYSLVKLSKLERA